jgi:hypothetical protein
MHIFEAGKGINALNINKNFTDVMDLANANEVALLRIEQTALRKDGRNLTQDVVTQFQQDEPIILENQKEDIVLTDNKTHFLSLSGAGKIVLPTIADDQFSHTITLIVDGSSYSLDLGSTNVILTKGDVDVAKTYSVLYIYHKIHRAWYYYISQ